MRQAIKAPSAGRVIKWNVAAGAVVEKYATLGEFEDDSGPVELTAPVAGIMGRPVASGAAVQAGATLCYIAPPQQDSPLVLHVPIVEQSRQNAPRATQSPTRANNAPIAPAIALEDAPPPAPTKAAQSGPRRGFPSAQPQADQAALAAQVVELESKPKGKGRAKPKRTRNRTYSIGEHQEAALARLAGALSLEHIDNSNIPAVNESELVRAAVEMLLGLPRPALLDVIKANKEREKAGAFGVGRPRPGKV